MKATEAIMGVSRKEEQAALPVQRQAARCLRLPPTCRSAGRDQRRRGPYDDVSTSGSRGWSREWCQPWFRRRVGVAFRDGLSPCDLGSARERPWICFVSAWSVLGAELCQVL